MECFRPLGKLRQVSLFEGFGECVKQTPDIPAPELLVHWLSPFPQNRRNQPVAAHPNISCTNDQVMCCRIAEPLLLVDGDAFVLIVPLFHQPANSPADKLRKIAQNEPGMF